MNQNLSDELSILEVIYRQEKAVRIGSTVYYLCRIIISLLRYVIDLERRINKMEIYQSRLEGG